MKIRPRCHRLANVVMASLLVFATINVSGPTGRVAAPQQADPRFEELASLISEKMAEYRIPGVAFGVVKDGVTLSRGFGVTNVDNPQPVTTDTIFTIASISKTVAATAIMRLVEQGRLDLDAPVRRYLPNFKVQDETVTRDVAIWNLMTHTPGWEGQVSAPDRGDLTLEKFMESMRDAPQVAPPGAVWSYNNAGFALSGRVIEVVTGQSIHDAFRELVFRPLGLTRTFTDLATIVTYRVASGHRERGGRTEVVRPFPRGSSIPSGGVKMSMDDMLTYGLFHLGDGTGANNEQVLGRRSLEQMRIARVPKHGTDDEMGIGWHLREIDGVVTATGGGTSGGNCLLLELVPERNLAISILTNHSDGWKLIQDVERAALKLYEDLSMNPGHAITNRGVNETMPSFDLLSNQPSSASYVGLYRRPPLNSVTTIREVGGQLILGNANGTEISPIAFYAPDRAVMTSDGRRGSPVDFIRDRDGVVRWIRSGGRVGRKD